MDFEWIKSLLDSFDPADLMPDLSSALGRLELYMRLLVLIAPLVLLAMGLVYFFLPPKEANHSLGYRFFWGMSSVEAWRFMQWIAGMVFGLLGIVLTIVMLILSGDFRGMETVDMVWKAGKYVLWELGLVAAACAGVDITMLVMFDRKGCRRPFAVRAPRPKKEKKK